VDPAGRRPRARDPGLLAQDRAALLATDERDGVERALRVARHLLEETGVGGGQALDRALLEEVRPVVEADLELPALLECMHREVVLRDLGRTGQRLGRVPAQLLLLPRQLVGGEHDPEERGSLPALPRHCLDHRLDRRVLVGVGGQRGLALLGQQRGEAGPALHARAQDEGVDEAADEAAQRAMPAARDRGPDADVVLSGEAVKERAEPGLQHHERRGAVAAAEIAQPLPSIGVDDDRQRGGGASGSAAPRLERKRALAGPLQPVRPGRHPAGKLVAAQPAPLPRGIVGVLHRQRRQGRALDAIAAGQGGVQRAELAPQDRQRPAVARDVVERGGEDVLLVAQANQARAQERPAGQIEGRKRLVTRDAQDLGLALRGAEPAEIEDRELPSSRRAHLLARRAASRGEDGPQDLVPADQLLACAAQRLGVEPAAQPARERDVIRGAAGIELIQEPHPLLRERERQIARARDRQERRRGAARAGARPAHPGPS
jgi:hypothetical protein